MAKKNVTAKHWVQQSNINVNIKLKLSTGVLTLGELRFSDLSYIESKISLNYTKIALRRDEPSKNSAMLPECVKLVPLLHAKYQNQATK